ncbi:unnamed protein product [Sphagnum balticum]
MAGSSHIWCPYPPHQPPEDLHSGTHVVVWLGGHLGLSFLVTNGELVYTPGSGPLSFATIVVLLYIDYMVMFSTDVGKLVEMLKVVDFWASETAMRINATKTQIMSVGRGAPSYLLTPPSIVALCWCSLSSIWEASSTPRPACRRRLMFAVHVG